MRELTKEEIEVLQRHAKWLKNEEGGEKANLRDANLRDANLRDANLRDADLWDANLRDANLRDADLWGADLRGADLRGANLRDANLRDADLRDADLWGADLRDADLRGANLRDANLRDADLRDADLWGADLRDANLRGAAGKILSFGPIGSRQGITYVTKTERTIHVRCGCFYGTLEEFAAKVEEEHGDSQHGKSYKAAIEFIKAHDAACWQDDVEE